MYLLLYALPDKSMDFILSSPKWMLSLLSTNQSQGLLNSVLSFSEIVSRSLAWKTRHVSSAYNSISHLIAPCMSLTYKSNNRGPRIGPWETPHSSFLGSEKLFSTLTRNVLLVRSDLNHIFHWVENCRWTIFWRSISWSIMSNAFYRSIRIRPVIRPQYTPLKSYHSSMRDKCQYSRIFWNQTSNSRGYYYQSGMSWFDHELLSLEPLILGEGGI